MRVVVNRLATLGPKSGIGHYTAQLLRCLVEQAGTDRVDCFPSAVLFRARQLWERIRPNRPRPPRLGPQSESRVERSPLQTGKAVVLESMRRAGRKLLDRDFRRVFRNRPCDLYHEPNLLPLPCDRPTVATFADLSVLLHPQWHPRDRVAEYERLLPPALARCVHFFAISEFTRQEVIQVLGIAPERVSRIYMGVRPGLTPLPAQRVTETLHRLGLPPRYLLHVGTIEPRKNLDMLLRAYCALPDSLRARTPLVLVGGWGWSAEGLAEYLHTEARHRGVLHLGYVPEHQLAPLYSGARALVYPSFYEGFGLPPLEMFACGGPVLASTAGALVETLAGRAHHLDPDDRDGWSRAMRRVIEDDAWHQELCRDVTTVARPYTWERCAAETWQVYRRLGGVLPAPSTSHQNAA